MHQFFSLILAKNFYRVSQIFHVGKLKRLTGVTLLIQKGGLFFLNTVTLKGKHEDGPCTLLPASCELSYYSESPYFYCCVQGTVFHFSAYLGFL